MYLGLVGSEMCIRDSRYTQVNIGPWNNRRRRSVAGRPSKRSDVDVTAEANKRSIVDTEDAEGNVVHCRLEEKRNLADSEAKAAFSMPAVRTLGDRRNGGVRPTAHVPQYLPLFPTTRTVRHSRRPLHADRCKLRGNNCIKRILGYLAKLCPFLYVLFGKHCDSDQGPR